MMLVMMSTLSWSDLTIERTWIRWVERDGSPVFPHPGQFEQKHPLVIDEIAAAGAPTVCGTIADDAPLPSPA